MSLGKSKRKDPSPFNKEQGICRDASGAVIPCEEGGLVRKKASPPNKGGGPEETAENQDMLKKLGHLHTEDIAPWMKKVLMMAMPGGLALTALQASEDPNFHRMGGPGGGGLGAARVDHPSSFKHEGRILDPSSALYREINSRERAQKERDETRRKERGAPAVPRGTARSGSPWNPGWFGA